MNFLLLIILIIKSISCQQPPKIQETPIQLNQEFQNNFLSADYYQPPGLNNYFPPNNQFPSNNYYPPTNSYPTWNYCVPPQLSPTYYVCPEPFYFFNYEPLLMSNTDADDRKARLNKFADYFFAQPFPSIHQQQSPPPPPPPPPPPAGFQPPSSFPVGGGFPPLPSHFPSFYPSRPTEPIKPVKPNEQIPEAQAQASPNITTQSLRQLDGPIWEILKQTYDKCCPLNRNRMRPIQTRDEISLYQRLFNSYGKLNNTLQGQGIYGIIENFDAFQSMDSNPINPSHVQLLSSSGIS